MVGFSFNSGAAMQDLDRPHRDAAAFPGWTPEEFLTAVLVHASVCDGKRTAAILNQFVHVKPGETVLLSEVPPGMFGPLIALFCHDITKRPHRCDEMQIFGRWKRGSKS